MDRSVRGGDAGCCYHYFINLSPSRYGENTECGQVWACPIMVPEIALSCGRAVAPPNTWPFGPTRVHIPNGASIGLSDFVKLTAVSNRHTDGQIDRQM